MWPLSLRRGFPLWSDSEPSLRQLSAVVQTGDTALGPLAEVKEEPKLDSSFAFVVLRLGPLQHEFIITHCLASAASQIVRSLLAATCSTGECEKWVCECVMGMEGQETRKYLVDFFSDMRGLLL